MVIVRVTKKEVEHRDLTPICRDYTNSSKKILTTRRHLADGLIFGLRSRGSRDPALLDGAQQVLPGVVHGVTHVLHGAAHAGLHGPLPG